MTRSRLIAVAALVAAVFAVLAIVAGSGSRRDAATRPGNASPSKAPRRELIATLGDSITAGTPGWDPNPGVRAVQDGTGATRRSQWQYWAERRHPKLRFRNCGVNRERTDQIALRFDRCVAGAGAVVIQGGINDIAQGYRPEVPARNLEAMVVKARGQGLRVAIAELLPWNNGYPDADPYIQQLNSRIREIARRRGAAVLPFYKTLEDPNAPGRMRAAWTEEGDHPSIVGYRRLGELAFRLPT